jgi:hypothetical protein
MKVRLGTVPAVVAAIALLSLSAACSGGAAPAPSGSQPSAAAGGGGAAPASQPAPTAAPAAKAAPASQPAAQPSGSGAAGTPQLQTVSMPTGSRYDPYKPVKIGDVVELPLTGLVLQVTGARTVDYDAQRDLLLVDLILGNKGREKLPVSSIMMMDAISSDWRTYGLTMEEMFQVIMKISSLNIATFDTELQPNEAKKGTAVIPVAKAAEGLGFVFYPTNFSATDGPDPTVYVGLGIKGDFPFPIIPEDVQAFKEGTTYKIGQAAKAPKRNAAVQLNGARERTQSGPGFDINVADKIVLVDVTTRLFGDAAEVFSREWALTDSSGGYFGTEFMNEVIWAENGMGHSSLARRGLLVFEVPRDAGGLKLVFGAMQDEKIEFDLGTPATSTILPGNSSPGSAPRGPKLVDASTLPAELKAIPIPSGFGVVEDSVLRTASRGVFVEAWAELFGKMKIKDVHAFYAKALENDWEIADESVSTGYLQNAYTNIEDESLILYLNAEETDAGTTIGIWLAKN